VSRPTDRSNTAGSRPSPAPSGFAARIVEAADRRRPTGSTDRTRELARPRARAAGRDTRRRAGRVDGRCTVAVQARPQLRRAQSQAVEPRLVTRLRAAGPGDSPCCGVYRLNSRRVRARPVALGHVFLWDRTSLHFQIAQPRLPSWDETASLSCIGPLSLPWERPGSAVPGATPLQVERY
jgi:hypothetical protein